MDGQDVRLAACGALHGVDAVRRGGGAAGDRLARAVLRCRDHNAGLRRHIVQRGEAQVDAVVADNVVQRRPLVLVIHIRREAQVAHLDFLRVFAPQFL